MSFDPRNNGGSPEERYPLADGGNRGGVSDGLDPRLLGNFEDSEENYAPENEAETRDYILLGARCCVVVVFLAAFVAFLVLVLRGRRLKNWRLYALCGLIYFAWLALSLYHDYIDAFFVHAIYRYPQPRSIYWCFRNLVHGLTIYMVILFLSHLSDFQHRGGRWLCLVFTAILVPLLYSVALLVVDLHVHPDDRLSWEWNVGIRTVRCFLYNVVTTGLLIGFSPRFCTERLYSTYEDRRSPLIVHVARWTFTFVLLHNLSAMASYGATVAVSVGVNKPGFEGVDIEDATIVHQAMDEVELFFMACAVPIAYLLGLATTGCCGGTDEADVEMAKMDKIYQEVWKSDASAGGGGVGGVRKGRNGSVIISSDPMGMAGGGGGGGIRSPGSTGSNGTASTAVVANGASPARPSGGGVSLQPDAGAINGRRSRQQRDSYLEATSGGGLNTSNLSMASVASNGSGRRSRQNRESYLDAVTYGSVEDFNPNGSIVSQRSSVTSQPIDL